MPPDNQDGKYAQENVCYEDSIFCYPPGHDGTERYIIFCLFIVIQCFPCSPDKPDCSGNQTVCTCNTQNNCNSYNASSTFSPALSTTTMADTMRYSDDDMMMILMMMMYRCWFGEKHPSTGNETWKVEVCQDNEDHCYQVRQAGQI